MQRKLRDRGGMTLVELLISMALMGFLAAGIAASTTVAAPALDDSLTAAQTSVLADTIYKALSGELRYATVVSVSPTGSDFTYQSPVYGAQVSLFCEMGMVWVNTTTGKFKLLPPGMYSDLTVDLTVTPVLRSGGGAVDSYEADLTVYLPNGNEQQYLYQFYPAIQ